MPRRSEVARRRALPAAALVIAVAASLWGCDSAGDPLCVPGASQACACSDGGAGAQVCAPEGGSWGLCVCDAPPGGGAGDGGGAGGGAGDGGGAGGGEAGGEGEGGSSEGEGEGTVEGEGEGEARGPGGSPHCEDLPPGGDEDCCRRGDPACDEGLSGEGEGEGEGEGAAEGEGEGAPPLDRGRRVAELCDGLDNDGDGQTDEGLSPEGAPRGCGGCDDGCDLPNAEPTCVVGECLVLRCHLGWADEDRLDDNGCEAASLGRVLHVNDDAAGPGTGSADQPFPTIQAALAETAEGDTVLVAAGVYFGSVVLDVPGVALRGAGRDVTFLLGDGLTPVIELQADYSSVQSLVLSADGASTGVLLSCREGCALIDSRVEAARGPPGARNTPGGPATGVRVEGVRFGRVGGNEVSDVMAGPAGENSGNKAPSGGEAAAVRLNEAREGAFFGNVIDGVTGGTGGLGNGGRSGGGGGGGHGFVLVGTLANSVVDNWVIAASGGTGGTGTPPGSGGEGGLAVGVVLSESSGNRVASNRLDGLTGGASGNQGQAAAGVAGVAFGVFLAPDALDNVVSDTNEVDGESVIYLHGEQDQVVQGYRLVGDTRPTNLGKIAVVECRNIVVRGNEVAGLVGPGGPSGGYHGAGGAGAEAVAILVRDSEGVAVEDNTVSGIRGGPGGMGGYERAGGRGGLVAAIRLDAVVGGRVEGNTVTDVTAGAGGAGAAGGPGGTAVGVHIVRSDGVTLLRNTLTGLAGGPSPPDQRPGSSGEAVGVLIEESDDVRASHLLVSQPRGALAYGVRLSGAGGRLDAATIFEPEGTSDAACVLVDAGSTLSVTGSILTSASHYGVRSADDNPADAVTVAWSDVWDNPAGDLDNVAVGEGVLSADPLFTSPRAEDFSLREDSPCVDAGDPDADCVAEPQAQDGSCRLDLGHLASSPQARSAP